MRVLVVEDYAPVRRAVSQGLTEAAYAVDAADNGRDGLWYAESNAYDVVVLDLMLPEIDGLSILRRLRQSGSTVPVLLLTAKDAVDDRVQGLDAGADDYLVKPFAFKELLARVRALCRRRYDRATSHDHDRESDDRHGDEGRVARRGAHRTHKKGILAAGVSGDARGRVRLAHGNLGEFVSDAHSNVVDVYIRYLRNKLERPGWPPLLHTRRGFGYRLAAEGVAS